MNQSSKSKSCTNSRGKSLCVKTREFDNYLLWAYKRGRPIHSGRDTFRMRLPFGESNGSLRGGCSYGKAVWLLVFCFATFGSTFSSDDGQCSATDCPPSPAGPDLPHMCSIGTPPSLNYPASVPLNITFGMYLVACVSMCAHVGAFARVRTN